MEVIRPFQAVYDVFSKMKDNKEMSPHILSRLDALKPLLEFVHQRESEVLSEELSNDVHEALKTLTDILESANQMIAKFSKMNVLVHMAKANDYNSDFENLNKSMTDAFVTLSGALHLHQMKKLKEQAKVLEEQEKKLEEQVKVLKQQKKKLEEQVKVLKQQKKKLEEQAKVLEEQAKVLEEQDEVLEEQEKKLEEQDEVLKKQEKKLEEQDEVLEQHKKKLEEQDEVLKQQKKKLEEQDEVLEEQEKKLEGQAKVLEEQEKMLAEHKNMLLRLESNKANKMKGFDCVLL